MTRRARIDGFTLLELIVAIALLAVVAVLAWRGLDEILRTRDALAQADVRIDHLQRLFRVIEDDALAARQASLPTPNHLRLDNGAGDIIEYAFDAQGLTRQLDDQAALHFDNDFSAAALELWVAGTGWTAVNLLPPGAPQGTPASAPEAAVAALLATQAAGSASASTNASSNTNPGNSNPNATANAAPPNTPPTGMRITLTLRDGAIAQRVFLLGSGA